MIGSKLTIAKKSRTMSETLSHKAGYVAVVGRPNVGKSTLVNAFVGQKIAAVSPRPQTTRRDQLGILTQADAQVIFVDTPGMHVPRHKLGQHMNEKVQEALQDADLILFLVDVSELPGEEDRLLAERIVRLNRPSHTLLVLNKLDLLTPERLAERSLAYQALVPGIEAFPVSAARGDRRDELLATVIARMPAGEAFYPEDQVTDLYEREITADLIREATLLFLRDEVPHGVAVRVDEFTERDAEHAYVAATIFVERESHKPIIIGQGGTMLKKIGSAARVEIEKMSGRKIFLELRVKVQKNWRDDEKTFPRLLGERD